MAMQLWQLIEARQGELVLSPGGLDGAPIHLCKSRRQVQDVCRGAVNGFQEQSSC